MPAEPHGAAAIAPIPPPAGPHSGHHRVARQVRREVRRAPRPGRRPALPRRAGCRTSCAGSGARRRRRTGRAPRARPSALRFAPSTYTWPPCSCTTAHTSTIPDSNTPCVDGYVAISAPSRSACSVALCFEVVEVDVAVVVGGHHHDAHPGHHRARRVGAVGRRGDQAHVAVLVTPVAVVRADREEAGQLALGPGVRLERHRGVAGDLAQPVARGRVKSCR